MGVQIIRGSRSDKYSAKDWTCSCGYVNRVKKFLIFDLPPLRCEGKDCKKQYEGLIYFNLADVEVNGRSLLPDVKDQRPEPECVPFAFAHAQELNDIVESIIMSDEFPIETIDPMVLSNTYKQMFHSVKDNTDYGGYHKYLHTGPILSDSSREVLKDAERETRSECCAVNRSRPEHVFQCIADGRGVVGVFPAGPKLQELKFGQVFFSPSDSTFEHAVLLIGAIVGLGRLIYIFLNSWGKEFCAFRDENGDIVMDENGNIAMGGVGMVETCLSCNPIVLSRSWETGVSGRLSVSWRVDMDYEEVSEEVDQVVHPSGRRPTFMFKKVWKSDDLGPFGVEKDENKVNQDILYDEADTSDSLMRGKINMPNVECTPWSPHGHNWVQPNTCLTHTPLKAAVLSRSEIATKLLIEAGAHVNVGMPDTSLIAAAIAGLTDFVMGLLKAGADANITDDNGRTPLEIAAIQGYQKCVEVLFPVTDRLAGVADWSIDGVIQHAQFASSQSQDLLHEYGISEFEAEGDSAFFERDYSYALTLYTMAIEIDPDDSTLYAKRSLCFLHKGHEDKALEDAETYKYKQPDLSETFLSKEPLVLVKEFGAAFEALNLD